MYTCYAIDDEDYALEKISEFINQHGKLILKNVFNNSLRAQSSIMDQEAVDIIFMDIEMPDLNGIELAKRIRHKAKKLIFTSAHSRYSYNAFEVDANDFLLKPYSYSKFETAVNKLFSIDNEKEKSIVDYLFVKNKHSNERIKLRIDEIISIEAKLHSVKIFTLTGMVETNLGFMEIKELLSKHCSLLQVHRSFIVFLKHVVSINLNRIKMTDNSIVPIGKKYKAVFDEYFL